MFNVKISKLLLATITFLSSTTGLQALQAIDNYLTELQARHNLDPQFENRRLGGYLGLMCGDMFGLALECQTRARFLKNPVEHILDTDNKHFRFRASAGAFSDDFSMALCVAEAIRSAKAQNQWANVLHFSTEFKEWAFNGKFACHETLGNNFQQLGIKANCIGVNIKAALTQGQLGKNASNGCLMRNYPVLLLADQNNLDTARYFANEHSKATHQSYLASVMLTDLCHKLLYANNPQTNKQALIEDFFNRYSRQCSDTITRYISSKVQTIINEMKTGDISQFKFYYDDPSNPNLNHHHEDEIEGQPHKKGTRYWICSNGCAGASFVAAIWAVLATNSFDNAIKAAANLGNDADTVAAITGQIAGVIYGAASIGLTDRKGQSWLDIMAPNQDVLRQDVFSLYERLVSQKFTQTNCIAIAPRNAPGAGPTIGKASATENRPAAGSHPDTTNLQISRSQKISVEKTVTTALEESKLLCSERIKEIVPVVVAYVDSTVIHPAPKNSPEFNIFDKQVGLWLESLPKRPCNNTDNSWQPQYCQRFMQNVAVMIFNDEPLAALDAILEAEIGLQYPLNHSLRYLQDLYKHDPKALTGIVNDKDAKAFIKNQLTTAITQICSDYNTTPPTDTGYLTRHEQWWALVIAATTTTGIVYFRDKIKSFFGRKKTMDNTSINSQSKLHQTAEETA